MQTGGALHCARQHRACFPGFPNTVSGSCCGMMKRAGFPPRAPNKQKVQQARGAAALSKLMQDPIRRLRLVMLLLFLLLLSGTAGYIFIEHMSLLDAAYMTVITLTTVGYREVKGLSSVGKLFTMGLLLVGVSVLAWALQSVVESVVSDQLTQGVWRRRMNRAIARMKDHYIICGHGRMGQQITQELHRQHIPFVVIEP
ncbi:MAG TPA: ion channel, partial [Armatimonadota bacterium]|nr:ion channel [Armatimonadota bacterium]